MTSKFDDLGGIRPISNHEFIAVPEIEIKAIERDLGAPLPSSYREFLATYGACTFGNPVQIRSSVASSHQTANGWEFLPFDLFYGIDPEPGHGYDLRWNIEIFKDRMPESVIPIGEDPFGNQVCLGVKGVDRGKVYFWDHENEWDEEDYVSDYGVPMPAEMKFQNMHLIADSFDDLLQRLESDPQH